jgi:O-antigen ligase
LSWGLGGLDATGRFAAPGVHPGLIGSYAGIGLIGLFAPRDARPIVRSRALAAAAGLLLATSLIASRSRTALLATLVGLLFAWFRAGDLRLRTRAILTAVIGVSGWLLITHPASPIALFIRRGQTAEGLASLSGRLGLWSTSMEMIRSRPLFGYGYGAVQPLLQREFDWAGTAHNAPLEAALSTGVIGALLLLLFAVLVGRANYIAASGFGLGAVAWIVVSATTSASIARPGLDLVVLLLAATGAGIGRARSRSDARGPVALPAV